MYSTMTVTDFQNEITRKGTERKDYVRPTSNLQVQSEPGTSRLVSPDGNFLITEHAHSQIAQDVGIPGTYYRRMLHEQPDLLDRNVNTWLTQQSSEQPHLRMIRTLPTPDGSDRHARAYVSNSFERYDDYELMHKAVGKPLGEIQDRIGKELTVVSCNVDENLLNLKVVADAPQFSGEVRKRGDIVQFGLAIRNSETGLSRLTIEPLIYELVCTNGMVSNVFGKGFERVHRGARLGEGNADRYLTDETRRLEKDAFWSGVADIIRGTFQEDVFQRLLNKLQEAAGNQVENPTHAMETVTERYGLLENETEIVQDYVSSNGEWDQWGLVRGITFAANHAENYERATELEHIGGQLLALAPREWRVVSCKR